MTANDRHHGSEHAAAFVKDGSLGLCTGSRRWACVTTQRSNPGELPEKKMFDQTQICPASSCFQTTLPKLRTTVENGSSRGLLCSALGPLRASGVMCEGFLRNASSQR